VKAAVAALAVLATLGAGCNGVVGGGLPPGLFPDAGADGAPGPISDAPGGTVTPDRPPGSDTPVNPGGPPDQGGPPPLDAPAGNDAVGPGPDAPPPVDAHGGPGAPLPAGQSMQTLMVDGQMRQLVVQVPDGAGPFPAILALHGNGDTASNFLATSGLATTAAQQGFVVIAAQAIPGSSPVGGVDWDAYTQPPSADHDMNLVSAVLDLLAGAGNVDPQRLYLLGYSQGGYLGYYAAMSFADRLAAAHISAAADPQPGRNIHLTAPRKIPVDLLIGTNDFGIDNARNTRDELMAASWTLRYTELPGVGHVPFQSSHIGDIVSWLGGYRLP
jgi:polyhydroxybutyrate depolymerase